MGTFINLAGQKFNRLSIIERVENSRHNMARWECLCDCGSHITVIATDLKSGHTKSCGCYRKEKIRKYNLNEHYFEKIDSKEKAYILGFIYADGALTDAGRHYRLTFGQHRNDREVLEYIKECLNYSGPIHCNYSYTDKRNGQTYHHDRLRINSKNLVKDLIMHGAIPRKSLILAAPILEREIIGSFIRGYFDGDGTAGLYKKGPVLVFLGTFKLLSWIKDNTENSPNIHPTKNIYELRYQSKKSIMPLIELMDESPFGLSRKTKKLNEIVSYLKESNIQERKRIGYVKIWKTRRANQQRKLVLASI